MKTANAALLLVALFAVFDLTVSQKGCAEFSHTCSSNVPPNGDGTCIDCTPFAVKSTLAASSLTWTTTAKSIGSSCHPTKNCETMTVDEIKWNINPVCKGKASSITCTDKTGTYTKSPSYTNEIYPDSGGPGVVLVIIYPNFYTTSNISTVTCTVKLATNAGACASAAYFFKPYTTATLWPQFAYYDYTHKCCGTGPTPVPSPPPPPPPSPPPPAIFTFPHECSSNPPPNGDGSLISATPYVVKTINHTSTTYAFHVGVQTVPSTGPCATQDLVSVKFATNQSCSGSIKSLSIKDSTGLYTKSIEFQSETYPNNGAPGETAQVIFGKTYTLATVGTTGIDVVITFFAGKGACSNPVTFFNTGYGFSGAQYGYYDDTHKCCGTSVAAL